MFLEISHRLFVKMEKIHRNYFAIKDASKLYKLNIQCFKFDIEINGTVVLSVFGLSNKFELYSIHNQRITKQIFKVNPVLHLEFLTSKRTLRQPHFRSRISR